MVSSLNKSNTNIKRKLFRELYRLVNMLYICMYICIYVKCNPPFLKSRIRAWSDVIFLTKARVEYPQMYSF